MDVSPPKARLLVRVTLTGDLELHPLWDSIMRTIRTNEWPMTKTFVSVIGRPGAVNTVSVTDVLKYFGGPLKCDLTVNLHGNEPEDEEDSTREGIFLVPLGGYTTAYTSHFDSDGSVKPITVGILGLEIRAPTADLNVYSLLINFCIAVSSHVIYLDDPYLNHDWHCFHPEIFLPTNGQRIPAKIISFVLQPEKKEAPALEPETPSPSNSESSSRLDVTKSLPGTIMGMGELQLEPYHHQDIDHIPSKDLTSLNEVGLAERKTVCSQAIQMIQCHWPTNTRTFIVTEGADIAIILKKILTLRAAEFASLWRNLQWLSINSYILNCFERCQVAAKTINSMHDLEVKVEEKLLGLETRFQNSYKEGGLEAFIDSIDDIYKLEFPEYQSFSQINPTTFPAQMYSKLRKRIVTHRRAIDRAARAMHNHINTLETRFMGCLRRPFLSLPPVPQFRPASGLYEFKHVCKFADDMLREKYEHLSNMYETYQKKIQDQIILAEIDVREENVKDFKKHCGFWKHSKRY